MELSEVLYISLIFHFVGDYLFQNDWMAHNKSKSSFVAIIHSLVYSALFLLIVSWEYWLIISVTHFFIDRFSLASYWVRSSYYTRNLDKPAFISFWVTVIVNNTWHVILNTIAIFLHFKHVC